MLMRKETSSRLPCLLDHSRGCDCPLVKNNAAHMNKLGKNRGLRNVIQRQGYDKVNVGLIKELLTNPKGSFYTEAFNTKLKFPQEMLQIRYEIGRERLSLLLRLENPKNIKCSAVKENIEKSGTSPEEYLNYLRENF